VIGKMKNPPTTDLPPDYVPMIS
jgi:hypothetical protein